MQKSSRRNTQLDPEEMLAYKKQKIKTELNNRRLLEEILQVPFAKRSAEDQSALAEILLSFPSF